MSSISIQNWIQLLPRITNIDCPNESCASRHMVEQKDGTELPETEKKSYILDMMMLI